MFSFRDDWHLHDPVNRLVRQYQTALEAAVRSDPTLQSCLTHCTHCGIRFLTHPRNAGRSDLRCPFGCREQHRRHQSNQRSTAYYQTTAGRRKKKRLNATRSCRSSSYTDCEQQQQKPIHEDNSRGDPLSNEPRGEDEAANQLPVMNQLDLPGVALDETDIERSAMLPYMAMVVGVIERIYLKQYQLVDLLRQALRQHSIVYETRTDYVLRFLHHHPPKGGFT